MNKRERILLLAILIMIFSIRLYHIAAAPLEVEESWRQADTESIARNFISYRFNILYPNFNYDGPLPNIPALEFQVTTFIIAILYRIFGFSYIFARLVPICFFLLSAIYLYLFSKKYLSPSGCFLCLIIYGIQPITIYYSRAIMPESAALFFSIAALYYFDRWFDTSKHHLLALSAVFVSLAAMTKPPTLIIAFPMLYICYREKKWQWLYDKRLWLYAAAVSACILIYYSFSISVADMKYALGITRDVVLRGLPATLFHKESYLFFISNLPKAYTPFVLILAAVGLFSLNKMQKVLIVWFIASLLGTLLIVSSIKIYYYMVFFTIPCSLLAGHYLSKLYQNTSIKWSTYILVLAIACSSLVTVKPMYHINTTMQTQVQLVEQITSKSDLLVVGSFDPCLLSISGRAGWRFNLKRPENTNSNPYDELKDYINKGAKYFVPIQGKIYGDYDSNIINYLDKNYQKIELIKSYPIYKLK